MFSRNRGRIARLAGLLLLAAGPAYATSLGNLSLVDSSTAVFDDSGPTGSVAASSASIAASGAAGFDLAWAAVVGADTGGAGGGSFTQSFTGSLSISFEVTEAVGWSWVVNVDVVRAGALTIVSDGNGSALVTLDALTVSHAGAGALVGSLDLAAVGSLDNTGAPGGSPDLAFSQSSSAFVTGIGTGGAQLVTLVFTFTASAGTVDPAGGLVQGDEAALRMGIDSGLGAFSADDYPGTGARSLAGDGIFITAASAPAALPEPSGEALLALGLLLLGWFDQGGPRRRR